MERIFVACDPENIFGDARRHELDLTRTIDATVDVLRGLERRGILLGGIAIGDLDIVTKTAFALATARIRPQIRRTSGENAADLEIEDYVVRAMPGSTTTLVIASGDGIFARLVVQMRNRGLRVDIVAVPGTVSHELYRAADRFIPIDVRP